MPFDHKAEIEALQHRQASDVQSVIESEEKLHHVSPEHELAYDIAEDKDPRAFLEWIEQVAFAEHYVGDIGASVIHRVHDSMADDLQQLTKSETERNADEIAEAVVTGVTPDFVPNTRREGAATDVPDASESFFVPAAHRPFLDDDSLFGGGGGGGGGGASPPGGSPGDPPSDDAGPDEPPPPKGKPDPRTAKPAGAPAAAAKTPSPPPAAAGRTKPRRGDG